MAILPKTNQNGFVLARGQGFKLYHKNVKLNPSIITEMSKEATTISEEKAFDAIEDEETKRKSLAIKVKMNQKSIYLTVLV